MSKSIVEDRIKLFSIIDSFGEQGGTLRKIQEEFFAVTGTILDRRQFIRSKADIEELFGVKIECKRAGANSLYFVDKSGAGSRKEDTLRMCCMNAFLLNNAFSDKRMNNSRVNIAESYNNRHAKVVAQALAQRCDLHIRNYTREFNFTPYAMMYTESWYMFGKIPGSDELLVFSLNDVRDSKLGQDFTDVPDNFDLKKILAKFDTELPLSKLDVDDRLAFWVSQKNVNI